MAGQNWHVAPHCALPLTAGVHILKDYKGSLLVLLLLASLARKATTVSQHSCLDFLIIALVSQAPGHAPKTNWMIRNPEHKLEVNLASLAS